MQDYRHRRSLPRIPEPEHKEHPVREQLIKPENAPDPEHWRDTRPHVKKENRPIVTPLYNELYDSLRTTRGWRYIADAFANGTITPTAGASKTAPITVTLPGILRLSQWPDGVQAYWCIHSFGIAPQTTPATPGALEVLYIDNSGYTAPLGDFLSQSGGNAGQDIIIPNPITDPDNTSIGLLSVQLQPGAASPVAYNWSMGLGIAYLAPNLKGYKPDFRETFNEVKDAVHTYLPH